MQIRPTPAATDAQFLQHLLGASNRKNPVITLLEEIDRSGSINQAAKTVGMSYKAAWEKIENINNLCPQPLIRRLVGGRGGGGTVLTEAGHAFIERAHTLQREFTSFLNFFYLVGMQFAQPRTTGCGCPPIKILRGAGAQSTACSINR